MAGDVIFAKRLREARKAKKLSVGQVAERIYASLGATYKYEEANTEPSIHTLRRLCDVLGVSADYLIGRSDG